MTGNVDNDNSDLKEKVKILEDQQSKTTKENLQNKQKYLRFEAECKALHEQVDEKNKTISQLTIKKEELQALVEKLSSNEEEKDDSKRRLSAQIHTKEEKLITYEKQIRDYENEIRRLKEVERKSSKLEDELESLKTQMQSLAEKI